MSDLVDLTWRIFPAVALIAFGAGMALWGLWLEIHGLRRWLRGDHSKIVTWIQGFRLSIIGLALVGIGAAWAWQLTWLLVLSLAIGGEETLESSIVIYALKKGRRSSGPEPLIPTDSGPAKDRSWAKA